MEILASKTQKDGVDVELPNIEIPTVPKINSGPELLVKLSRRSHSSFVHIF